MRGGDTILVDQLQLDQLQKDQLQLVPSESLHDILHQETLSQGE